MITKCLESGNVYTFTVLKMKNLGLYSNYFGFVGLTLEKAKKAGLLGKGLNPMPREMSFPAQRGENWNDLYDFIRYISDSFSAY